MVGQIFSTDLLETCLKIGRFRLGRGGRFLTAPEKTRQISKIRQIFYDNQGTDGVFARLAMRCFAYERDGFLLASSHRHRAWLLRPTGA